MVTTGSWPIVPPIKGIDKKNILLCKNYDHAKVIIDQAKDAKNIVVVGAGYIGVELVEAFEILGKNVTLVDFQDRILPKYLDPEFTKVAEDAFEKRGVKLALDQGVEEFLGDDYVTGVKTSKGTYEGIWSFYVSALNPTQAFLRDKLKC